MELLGIRQFRAFLHNTLETIKRAITFGRKVSVNPGTEKLLPEAKKFFGRKALRNYQITHDSSLKNPPSVKRRLSFQSTPLESMRELTPEAFDLQLEGRSDDAIKNIRRELATYHQLLKTEGTDHSQSTSFNKLQHLAIDYLQNGKKMGAKGSAWNTVKAAVENLLITSREADPTYSAFQSGHGDKLPDDSKRPVCMALMSDPKLAAYYLETLGIEESCRLLKSFEATVNTDDFEDPVGSGFKLAKSYIERLSTRDRKEVLKQLNSHVPKTEEQIRAQALIAVAKFAMGQSGEKENFTRKAKLVHLGFQEGLSLTDCRKTSVNTIKEFGMSLNDTQQMEMMKMVDTQRIQTTQLYQQNPSLEFNLSDPASTLRASQIVWMDQLARASDKDPNFQRFIELYDQIYSETGTQWLKDVETTDAAGNKIKELDDPLVLKEAEKLNINTLEQIAQHGSRKEREAFYKAQGWPYPEHVTHPSTPFIRAIEVRYPLHG